MAKYGSRATNYKPSCSPVTPKDHRRLFAILNPNDVEADQLKTAVDRNRDKRQKEAQEQQKDETFDKGAQGLYSSADIRQHFDPLIKRELGI